MLSELIPEYLNYYPFNIDFLEIFKQMPVNEFFIVKYMLITGFIELIKNILFIIVLNYKLNIMKKTILALIFMMAGGLMVYSQTDYKMWETIYMVPKKGEGEALKKGLAEHNKKYHTGAYSAHIWNVFTGPHEGEMLWAMGPCTFTDLDARPEGDAHDKDWQETVEAHLEKSTDLKYWKLNEKLSYEPENAPMGKVIWTNFDIRPFEGYRFKEMLNKVVEVYKQKKYPYAMAVYESQFDSGDGVDIIVEWPFDKYSFFDREDTFKKDYEEVHGEGTWMQFMEEYKDVVEKSFDELAEYQKDLSSGE